MDCNSKKLSPLQEESYKNDLVCLSAEEEKKFRNLMKMRDEMEENENLVIIFDDQIYEQISLHYQKKQKKENFQLQLELEKQFHMNERTHEEYMNSIRINNDLSQKVNYLEEQIALKGMNYKSLQKKSKSCNQRQDQKQ